MKRIILFSIALLFCAFSSNAQEAYCDNKVKSISITDGGDYVMPYNQKDAYWTKTLPQNMIDKIWELYRKGESIKQVATKSDGGFVILWGQNQAKWSNVPDELSEKILELNKNGNTIKNIALRDDGAFVILWDRNQAMWTKTVPTKLVEKIKELNKAGDEIKQVVLTDNGDYIIRWGNNQAQWTTSIPSRLVDKIKELNRKGNKVDYIELTDDDEFVVIWDKNHSYCSDGIPKPLKKKLRELSCYDSDDESVTKPTITWNYPSQSNSTVTEKYQTIKACIKSEGDLDEVKLYLNGSLHESSRDFVIKKKSNNSCTLDFSKGIYLGEGRNTVKITATNEGGTTTSYTRTINVKKEQVVVKNDPPAPSANGKRVALIIGNANYNDQNAVLKNPKNDANAMEQKLASLGFKVIKATDATQSVMKAKIREFGQELKNNKIGLFYYAGHGFQIDGTNYLVPIDATIEDKADAEDACVSINYLLNKMDISGTETNLVILDACRNNPFRSWSRSSNSGGLTSLERQPIGSVIAFATQPGNVAADGIGSNGLYTSAWLQHLKKGKNIYEVLTNINKTVSTSSSEKQVPWFNSSLQGMFVF
ncbi:MAG: caspase family protein [Saprospiraceae bacterium]